MKSPFASRSVRAGVASTLVFVLCGLSSPGSAGARATTLGPTKAEPAAEPTVTVDVSEIPDFKRSLVEQLSVEAAAQAKEYGFEPNQIKITIGWIDAATSSYGVRVYIETEDAKLPDGPRGPLVGRCEQCSQKRVVEAAVEALLRGFELYEQALKEAREQRKRDEAQQLLEREQARRALDETQTTTAEQEGMARRKHRRWAIALLTVGGVAHALGITFVAIWRVEYPDSEKYEYLEFYNPGIVLLSLSPAPIAAGSVFLGRYLEASKKPKMRHARASLMGLRRGLGIGVSLRF